MYERDFHLNLKQCVPDGGNFWQTSTFHPLLVADGASSFSAVGDELVVNSDSAELMLFPLATTGTGVLIPVCTAEQVQETIVIHVEHGDAFGVIRCRDDE